MGDVVRCACGYWWIVKRGHDTWQRISKRKLRRLLLNDLARDLDDYARTGDLPNKRRGW